MTTEGRRVHGTITARGDCPERVAFDLMEKIQHDAFEDEKKAHSKRDRAYWLNLYRECRNAVYGEKGPMPLPMAD